MQAPSQKLSIKFKRVGKEVPPRVIPKPKKIKVCYIFLAKGGFLYDKETQHVYSLEEPHRFIGTLAEMITQEDG